MNSCILIIFLFLIVQVESLENRKPIEGEIIQDNVKNITNITLGEDASKSLFKQWQDQAVSGLMAAVASKKLFFKYHKSLFYRIKSQNLSCSD